MEEMQGQNTGSAYKKSDDRTRKHGGNCQQIQILPVKNRKWRT